jgi:hypothetical protein
MLRAFATHQGFQRFVCSAVTDLDVPALLALLQEAWQADSMDQVRPDFTEAFLRRLMAEQEWVGILVCTPAGQPIGFELALPRTLYCRQQPLRAYYATVFTVSSHYRRLGLDGSFRTQYLQPDATDAGTFWYDMDHGASCWASFYITPLMVNERRLHPVGQLHSIHSIHTQHCTPLHLERMLPHLGLYCSARGCFAITLYDQGAIPHDLLHRLGFRPAEDRYLFAVRGPRHAIDAFTTVHPPFFMDFT